MLSPASEKLDVPNCVKDKRQGDHEQAYCNRNSGVNRRDLTPKDMEQGYSVQTYGCCFSMPDRSGDEACFPNNQSAAHRHKELFAGHQEEGKQHQRKPHQQAEQHRYLGQLIRNGVQDLSKVADHVEPPGDQTVCNVGDSGEDQDASRQDVLLLPQVKPENDLDQAQAEKRKKIGN